jgi:hypothetical protein
LFAEAAASKKENNKPKLHMKQLASMEYIYIGRRLCHKNINPKPISLTCFFSMIHSVHTSEAAYAWLVHQEKAVKPWLASMAMNFWICRMSSCIDTSLM